MVYFFQNSSALVYVKMYQFNTYKKFRRVSLIVSRMVHYNKTQFKSTPQSSIIDQIS